jgi:lactose/L-arabinose transport system substrate-binding protein
MRKETKWFRRCLVATAMLTLTATGVAAKDLTVWCWDPNFNGAIMKEAAARYAKGHPDFHLNVVDFGKADVEQKLQTTLASGVKDNLPDIVLIEDYGVQKYLQSFPGAFAPLSGKIDFSTFAPYKVAVSTLNDKVYAVPFDSGVSALFYRADYLAAAGVPESEMQHLTWERFIEIGKQVEAKTGHKMISVDPSDGGFLRILMQSGGKWYFDNAGKVTIKDNEALKEAMEVEAKILSSGLSKPATGYANWVSTFTSGDVASVVSGVWIVGTIKAQKDQEGKWRVAPIPTLKMNGAVASSNLGGSSWLVLASSKEKDTAIDFLAQIYGKDLDFYQKILVDQGAVGTLLAARSGSGYDAADPFFGGEKIWLKVSDWLAHVPPVTYGVFTNEADAAIVTQIMPIVKGKPLGEALDAAAAQVQSQIQ